MIPHVLIVEDNALVIGALRLLLEETGHHVSAALSLREAIALLERSRPDLVLLDLTLPDGDGLGVMASFQGQERVPVVVAVTGHDSAQVRDRCLAAGCRDVLVKPIASMTLPAKIRSWLATDS